MFMKFTKGYFLDCFLIGAMLSFVLMIALVNYGSFPIEESVDVTHLTASVVYILFWALYIWLAHFFKRNRVLLFSRIFSTLTLIFTLWFVAASVNIAAIPSGLGTTFAALTLLLNNHYIGLYYFIPVTSEEMYALASFFAVMLNFCLSWGFWLYDKGYFEHFKGKFRIVRRSDRIREEIIEMRRRKEEDSEE